MMKTLLILLTIITLLSCSSSKQVNTDAQKQVNIKYFDENNIEINKGKFNEIRSTNKLLDIQGDSINHRKLTLREKRGKINNMSAFKILLETRLTIKLDSTKPIVIIYHPGKDLCNSTGTTNKKWIKNWYEQLEDGLNQVAGIKPIYLFKSNEGLKKYEGILNWKKDPEGITERLFFKYHYPCKSFVVISKKGDYISYFGEFGKEYVWEATEIMNLKIK